MHPVLALSLQALALFFAWLNAPWSLLAAGMLSLVVVFYRAKITLKANGKPMELSGHPWGEL